MPARRDPPSPPYLALTMGDPSGIGLDITLMAWHARKIEKVPPFCFYGDPDALAARAKALRFSTEISVVSEPEHVNARFKTALPVKAIETPAPVAPGMPSSENAGAVIAAIEQAVADVASGTASAVVTNPIAKSVLYQAGFKHPGHTEFLATLSKRHWRGAKARSVMMLSGKGLKVVPLTIHIPLKDAPERVTSKLIDETVRIVVEDLQRNFAIEAPRIAVAGLNPHAGEDGGIGREEIEVIAPAIARLRRAGYDVAGPLPADTMFHDTARSQYDAAVCMYHDQALIPIKTLAFDEGVNTTLGLPFIRTSPDHGTAFALAATGKASPKSLIAALKLADGMVKARAASGAQSATKGSAEKSS